MSQSNHQAGSAKRRHVRTIKVAPVTRAIRAALAVSATTLALTASGSLFAANCAMPASTAMHCHSAFQVSTIRSEDIRPVLDLARVRSDDAPGHVVDGLGGRHSGLIGATRETSITSTGGFSTEDASFAVDAQSLGAVQDLVAIDVLSPGAGGVSGSDNQIGQSFPGDFANTNNKYTSSSDGYADAIFATANQISAGTNSAAITVSGTTWAAGIEVEATDFAHDIGNTSTGSITATASGDDGQAWGIYAVATNDVSTYNAGAIDVSATGSAGTATGVFGYSPDGTAYASNSGNISADASGDYGQAWGVYAAAGDAATANNSGSITVFANGYEGSATGVSAYSSNGDASATNVGGITIDADGNATALRGYAVTGNANLSNSGPIDAYSYAGNAIGMYGYAAAGDVSIDNSGAISAYSFNGLADGIFASGASVDVANSSTGDISASGYTWAAGIEAQGSDLTTISNDATITAFAYAGDYVNRIYGHAFGIYATAGAGGMSIDNAGTITVDGAYSNGIYAQAGGSITIDNSGDIDVGTTYAQYATGIHAATSGENSNVDVVNSGNLNAYSRYGAIGIEVVGTGAGSTGNVTNSGQIYANQSNTYVTGATGIIVSTDGSATVDNNGSIIATSGGAAYGAIAQSFNGDASVTNSGDIGAYSTLSYSGAYGIIAFSQNGGASVDNSGNVVASSSYYGGYVAMGIQASGMTGAGVNNSGSVSVDAYYAYGVNASSALGDVSVGNTDTGLIDVQGIAFSIGVIGSSTDGNVSIENAGTVQTYAYGQSVGIFGRSTYGSVAATNSGYVQAFSVYGPAVAVFARADNGNVAVDNSGTLVAASPFGDAVGVRASGLTVDVANSGMVQGASLYGLATGIDVYGAESATIGNDGFVVASSNYGSAQGIYAVGGGDVSVSNGASGEIGAYANQGVALGVLAYSIAGNSTVDNAGTVVAQGFNGALGVYVGAYGDATVTSSGSITVDAIYGNANAISGYSATGDVNLGNTGSIDVYSYAGNAIGMNGYAAAGDVHINNSGTITAYSYNGLADGIFASGESVDVINSGTIGANGYAWAAGIEAQGSNLTTVNNDGTITAYAYASDSYAQQYGHAYGIFATGGASGVTVGNSGSITAMGVYAAGIEVQSEGGISITSTGDITVGNTYTAIATGIHAVNNYDASDITIVNGGDIAAIGYYGSTGIEVSANGAGSSASVTSTGTIDVSVGSKYGYGATGIVASADNNASVANAGSITTVSPGSSYGAVALAFSGNASVTNSGDIDVSSTAFRYYSAVGMLSASSNGAAYADNSGTVAVASSKYLATGIQVDGMTGATATNSGSISVDAKYAYGIVGTASQGDVAINNTAAGMIDVTSGSGVAVGALGNSTVGDVVIDNAGDIYAAAAYNAFGVFARSNDGNATVINGGGVYAYSYGATARGILVDATNGDAVVENSGSIEAVSPQGAAIGIYGRNGGGLVSVTSTGYVAATGGQAIGVLAYGAAASVSNAGTIHASNIDAGGLAAGVVVQGYAGAIVTNSGTISAESVTGSDAIGVIAQAYGNLLVDNSGLITATDDDYAIAVSLDSAAGIATLRNTGILRTNSTREGQIAVLGGDGVQRVLNYGDIYGAIVTGAGDDLMINGDAGVWHVTNHSTDFGDGDDSITNAVGGTIVLANGAIHLGASGSAGNSLTNNGTIQVRGHDLIDMGTGASPLTNNGVIDFVDGVPNDILTIMGDLAGDGAINVDISALNQTADLLYVDGSVVDGAAQTVNVNFAGVPMTAHVDPIDFAHIAGDSTAASFVGGGVVGYDPGNFLDLRVTVSSEIDASNASDDVFSVGVDVAGLNDTGALAASIASGAQSLINSQVGTWRQRMGVLPAKGQDTVGLSPWIRTFSDKGEVDPAHVAANFGSGGNFRYDQSNSGSELGMNVNIRGGVNIGLLLANSQGTQRLLDSGVGTDRMDGSAFGLYTTWIGSNGFYVDASYRWLDFDVDLTSAAGQQSTHAKGNAFNVEAGYTAWTLGGIDIAPQLQYTRSAVGNIDTLRGDRAEFVADGGNSSRGRLGVSFSKTIDGAGWIWTPYGSVNAVREFDGETTYTVADNFFGSTSTQGTSAMVELGLGAQKHGVSVTGGANWTDGGALQSFVGGQLVLRYTW